MIQFGLASIRTISILVTHRQIARRARGSICDTEELVVVVLTLTRYDTGSIHGNTATLSTHER